jgi:hypothetical protein
MPHMTRASRLCGQARYSELLHLSKYALAPGGHQPNSFRIAESVEYGATPIISKWLYPRSQIPCYTNWAALYGISLHEECPYEWVPRAPFVVIDDWTQLPDALHGLRQRHLAWGNRTKVLNDWYGRWRSAFARKPREVSMRELDS